MDGPGGCCIARYATGGVVYDAAKFDRIMLGFRPIAPKPAPCGSSSGRSSPERKHTCVRKTGRGRRRRSATSLSGSSDKNKRAAGSKQQRKSSENEIGDQGAGTDHLAVVTLPLLPESPEPEIKKERSACRHGYSGDFSDDNARVSVPATWLSVKGNATGLVQQQQQTIRRLVETWVTVESVTDTWMDAGGLGRTDEEKSLALEADTCPGLISDCLGRVMWTNDAFREMVAGPEDSEVAVWLAVKKTAAATAATFMHAAFTCRVRVQYARGKEVKGSLTLPCDVWRMAGGGFVWRLDVKAALSLGR